MKARLLKLLAVVLAGILILTAAGGYYLRGTAKTRDNLNAMRTQAVLHAASDGLLDAIASRARSEKLKELRARKDFRSLGLDEVNSTCDGAAAEARAAAEASIPQSPVRPNPDRLSPDLQSPGRPNPDPQNPVRQSQVPPIPGPPIPDPLTPDRLIPVPPNPLLPLPMTAAAAQAAAAQAAATSTLK